MKKIVVVVDNSGPATYLVHLIKHNLKVYQWVVVTNKNSAAHRVFTEEGLRCLLKENKLEPVKFLAKIRPDFLLCATGWSGFELPYTRVAKSSGLPNAVIFDNWNSQRERFGYPAKDWRKNLPDYIFVCDTEAYRLAKKFNFKNLIKLNNYYFVDILKQRINKAQTNQSQTVLYISETLSFLQNSKYSKEISIDGEKVVLEKILKNFSKFTSCFGVNKLIIRLHPSETVLTKYDFFKKQYPNLIIEIEKPQNKPLMSSLQEANMVLGQNSMGLFIAFLLGKITVALSLNKNKTILPLPANCVVQEVDDIFELKLANNLPYIKKLLFAETYNLGVALKKII
jgi:hypothetical protein